MAERLPHPDRTTVGQHLEELRRRLFRVVQMATFGLVVAMVFAPQVFEILHAQVTALGYTPQFMNLEGGMGLYLRVGLLGAMILGIPALTWQLIRFASPGLYAHERRILHRALTPVVILFLAGIVFGYLVVVPQTFQFLDQVNTTFAESVGVQPTPPATPTLKVESFGGLMTLSATLPPQVADPLPQETPRSAGAAMTVLPITEFLNLLLLLVGGMGVAFEMPVVLILLARLGIITPQGMRRGRRWFAFGILVLTLLLTADPVSAAILGVILYLMFEASILISAVWLRKVERDEAAAEAAS